MIYRKRMLRHGPRTGVLATSIGALIATGGLSTTALGQDETDEEEAVASDDAIVVTGTRIRRNDFTSTNATITVTAEDMRNLGVTSVAEMVNQLPSNVAEITPETGTDSTFNMGASVANLRGLNANGGSRTLVLVDSRRVIGSNSSGVVDMNMIPTALVGRIETVTGGASATYGADAMAGVVNVIIDNNVEGVRVDLSYSTTSEGDGDDVNLSLGTGFEVFDRRGTITVGYDRQNQDGIANCVDAREICRRSFGIYQNGTQPIPLFAFAAPPYTPVVNQYFPGQPQYIISEGFRYARVPEGYFVNTCTTVNCIGGGTATPNSQAPTSGNLATGIYRLSDDGLTAVPFYDDLTQLQRSAMITAGEGPNAMTPFGQGALSYQGVPLIPEQTRDNLYTRFAYDFEGGVELETSFTYGKTESVSQQNSVRQSYFGPVTFPSNAFLTSDWGATQFLRDVYASRMIGVVPPNFATMMGGNATCAVAPFLGDPGGADVTTYDYPIGGCNGVSFGGGTMGLVKDMAPFVGRYNTTDTEQWTWTVGANGDLFEGGSWTWDASLSYGESQRDVDVQGWQSSRRLEMAMNSEWDSTVNRPVCAIDNQEPYQMTDPVYPNPPGGTQGDYWEWKWLQYITRSLSTNGAEGDDPQYYFDTLSGRNGYGAPCAPFNPFGNNMYPGSVEFAFPSILDASENAQTNLSISFSGDAWRGFGNAGPVQMAAGLDFRFNETNNGASQNNVLDRDFGLNFSDDWNGETETNEAFVEFEVPLLRDKPGVDYLMTNLAYRYTDNTTRRLAGAGNFNPDTEDARSIESWKASMVWRPVDLLTVRLTRSIDTRAPSGTELFTVNRAALEESCVFSNPFRPNDPATTANESQEEITFFGGDCVFFLGNGGNASLEEEQSTTETLGIVFTPTEVLAGLSISIDYYETDIVGGITGISGGQVATRCRNQLQANGWNLAEATYCENIVFGDPLVPEDDMFLTVNGPNGPEPNPAYPYVNIEELTASSENSMPFLSRGIDLSVSYNTQLSGGGFINGRILASRSLEQRVTQTGGVTLDGLGPTLDVSGQTGSQGIGSIWSWAAGAFTNYAPTPRISGNLFLTYNKNAFTTTGQIRYVGTGDLTNQTLWVAPGDCQTWYPGYSIFTPNNLNTATQCYDPARGQMVTDNDLPSWTTLNLTFEYDFSRSAASMERFESLSVYFDIDNVADKVPEQFTGNGTGAQNTTFFSIMGRTYRLGARMQF
jgi:outer membrane receptor protein involved in Fe transport